MRPASRVQWSAVVLLLISGLGLLTALAAATGLFLSGLTQGLTPAMAGETDAGSASAQTLSLFSLAWISGLVVVLLIPVLASSVMTLLEIPYRRLRLPGLGRLTALRLASGLMLVWPFAVAVGELISRSGFLNWLLLPPIQIFVVAVPLWWLLELGRRGLPGGSPQRSWNVLGFSLVVTPAAILIVETVILVVLAVLVSVVIAMQPGALDLLTTLARRIATTGGQPTQVLRFLRPILQQPAVIYGLLAVMAGLIPLVEEVLKPVAVWGLVGRRLLPAEGFTAGLICGACFGLMESLGAVSTPAGGAWAFTVIGRFGTGLLHTVTAGLMGYGLGLAWSYGRYARLGLIFFLCAALHGIWNVFSLLMGFVPLLGLEPATPGPLGLAQRLSGIAPAVLVVLVAVLFLILLGANRRLKQEAEAELQGQLPPAGINGSTETPSGEKDGPNHSDQTLSGV